MTDVPHGTTAARHLAAGSFQNPVFYDSLGEESVSDVCTCGCPNRETFFWPEKFLFVPGTHGQTVRKNFIVFFMFFFFFSMSLFTVLLFLTSGDLQKLPRRTDPSQTRGTGCTVRVGSVRARVVSRHHTSRAVTATPPVAGLLPSLIPLPRRNPANRPRVRRSTTPYMKHDASPFPPLQ
jgi:hypothetical protein